MTATQKHLDLLRPWPVPLSWKVPALFCNDWAALRLLQVCSEISQQPPFDIVYGAPLYEWSGGRPSAMRHALSENELRAYLNAYQKFGVTTAFTLSRLEVPHELYADPHCNALLDLMDEYESEAIVYDDGLAAYIKRTHPRIKVVASLNKAMSDYAHGFTNETDYYLRLLEHYDEIVVRCEFAAEDNLIEQLADVSDRVEIIVNQFCIPNCKNVHRHLEAIEKWNRAETGGHCQACYSLQTLSSMDSRLVNNLFISAGRIAELSEKGFTRMKLAGRNSPLPKFLDMLSRYVFEPTGAISIIGNELMREYRIEATERNLGVQQYHLPPTA